MIRFTPKAYKEVMKLIEDGQILRMSVVGGGCSGLNYQMGFVSAKDTKLDDIASIQNGLVFVVDPKSFTFIDGTTVDYSDGLEGKGFSYSNPNAKRSCGCGSSFSC